MQASLIATKRETRGKNEARRLRASGHVPAVVYGGAIEEAVPVSVVMLGALSVGMIIGYGVALMMILAGKSEIRSLNNKNRHLSDELNELRNASIDEDIYDSASGDE